MLGSQHKTTRISRIKTGEYHNQMNQLTLDENSGKGTKRLRRMKRRNGKTKVEKNKKNPSQSKHEGKSRHTYQRTSR